MDYLRLHRLLRYDLERSQIALVHWDLHDVPNFARYRTHTDALGATLTPEDLSMSATEPSVTSLRIICDVLPSGSPMMACNSSGITVKDVLRVIHESLQQQMSMQEWTSLADKHRHRVKSIFDRRWRFSANPSVTREVGVLRIDTLLRHSFFGGLTIIRAAEPTCVLTLAVERSQRLPSLTVT